MSRRNLLLALLAVVVAVELLVRDGYEDVIEVHLEVLQGLAGKMAAVAASGGRPTPNDLTEMIYPLERARGFLDEYRDQRQRESYRVFASLVDEYAGLVSAVDAARGEPERWQAFRGEVEPRVARIDGAAERVRASLSRES
jgi:hypothetical protein